MMFHHDYYDKLPPNFEPKRGRWFAERGNYGREWLVIPALEDAQGHLVLMELVPSKQQVAGSCPLRGLEPPSAIMTPAEAQELMDALWESGLRPTRR